MKLLSIDIETTGLNPHNCSVLEVGCVLFDPCPDLATTTPDERRWQTFECLLDNRRIQGEAYALQMNQDILAEIAGVKKTHRQLLRAAQIGPAVSEWLTSFGVNPSNKATIVGKNYDAFDRQFLERIPGWKEFVNPFVERRVLDVGSLYFRPDDGKVVNLVSCLKTIGITKTDVSHRALDDALDVATAVSRFFN